MCSQIPLCELAGTDAVTSRVLGVTASPFHSALISLVSSIKDSSSLGMPLKSSMNYL